MITSRKYRIYPTIEQKMFLNKHFDAVRLVYNLALETKNISYYDYGVRLSKNDLQFQLTDLKKDTTWLNDINSQSLQGALINLDDAFNRYFRGVKDGTISKLKESYVLNRKKRGLDINLEKYNDIGKPKFKSKRDNDYSFSVPQNFKITNGKLYIPKLKTGIKVIVSQVYTGKPLNLTINKTSTEKYFISICIEENTKKPQLKPIKEETCTGVDLGIKTFATLSDGQKIQNPKYLKKAIDRLKIIQNRLSKKQINGKNRNKQRLVLARIHEKIKNQRKDFLHKTSTAIIKQYDTIVFEDLSIKNMVKNHSLAQSISDSSWGIFTTFAKYKCAKFGKNYIEINKYYPSSKIHSVCGYVNKNLTLKNREWHCPKCESMVDRDLNAAINIKLLGLGRPVEPLELPTLVGALKKETNK
jgi:putative transposase